MNHLQIKNKIQYSPHVFFILHAHVVCTLTWFFSVCVCVFFSQEISWPYIPDKNTVQSIQVVSFARSRFLVFPHKMVWLYILVRLLSNLFSFHSKNLINLNKAYIKESHCCSLIENLLNFSIPLSHTSKKT